MNGAEIDGIVGRSVGGGIDRRVNEGLVKGLRCVGGEGEMVMGGKRKGDQ